MKHSGVTVEKSNRKPMRSLDRDSHIPLYAQLHENLKRYIQENGLKPGERIPSETELVLQFSLSRMTARLAMQGLASEGIITRIQGKGTFVAEPKTQKNVLQAKGVENRFEQLEGPVETILLEDSLSLAATMYTDALKLPQFSQIYKVRRLKKSGDSVLGLETRFFAPEMQGRFSKEELNRDFFLDILSKSPDTAIHRVNHTISSALVMDLEAELLGLQPGSPILQHDGFYFNREDKPVTAGRMVYPAEKMKIHYETFAPELNGDV